MPASIIASPMRSLRALLVRWRLAEGDGLVPQLVEMQTTREIIEVTTCADESCRLEHRVQSISERITAAMDPKSPGGENITPEEVRPVARHILSAKRDLHQHTDHLKQLAS